MYGYGPNEKVKDMGLGYCTTLIASRSINPVKSYKFLVSKFEKKVQKPVLAQNRLKRIFAGQLDKICMGPNANL